MYPIKTASVINFKASYYYIDSNTNYAKTICKTTTKRMEGNILLSFILYKYELQISNANVFTFMLTNCFLCSKCFCHLRVVHILILFGTLFLDINVTCVMIKTAHIGRCYLF